MRMLLVYVCCSLWVSQVTAVLFVGTESCVGCHLCVVMTIRSQVMAIRQSGVHGWSKCCLLNLESALAAWMPVSTLSSRQNCWLFLSFDNLLRCLLALRLNVYIVRSSVLCIRGYMPVVWGKWVDGGLCGQWFSLQVSNVRVVYADDLTLALLSAFTLHYISCNLCNWPWLIGNPAVLRYTQQLCITFCHVVFLFLFISCVPSEC